VLYREELNVVWKGIECFLEKNGVLYRQEMSVV